MCLLPISASGGVKQERTCGRRLRPRHVTVCGAWLTQPARHAASVWSRTIMKNQPSVGAAADAILSYVQRAFLPGLTTSSTDRWIKATPRLFLSLNGEENGRWLFVRWLLWACQVGTEGRSWLVPLTGRSLSPPPCTLPPACQGTEPSSRGGGALACFRTPWLYPRIIVFFKSRPD